MPVSRFAAINQKELQPIAADPVRDQATRTPDDRTTGRPQGKRSHPDFEKVGLYLNSAKRKQAERKWEDEGNGDFSDLIDKLLTNYLGDR
jgi:hypothetical protein